MSGTSFSTRTSFNTIMF